MAEAAINLTAGQKADRKLDMIFVNVGGSGTETWELLGRGVEDASVEYNHDTDTVTDILGITDVNVSAAKPEIDLDPCTIRGGQKLSAKLLDIERRNAVSELSMFDVLHVHCFLGAASGSFTAESTPAAPSCPRAWAAPITSHADERTPVQQQNAGHLHHCGRRVHLHGGITNGAEH